MYFGIATTFMCVFFLGKRFDSLGVVWAWYGFDFVAIWFWSVWGSDRFPVFLGRVAAGAMSKYMLTAEAREDENSIL